MDKLKLLIIEDEPTINRILAKYFRNEGFEVFCALDGERGLEIFEEESLDFICLDIMIPKISGWEVAKTIREKSKIPIILMSALSEEEDILKGFSLHVDDYITKPFAPSVLIAKINSLKERITIERDYSSLKGQMELEGINFDISSYDDSNVLTELLTKDELTGVANRRYFEFHIANMIKEYKDFQVAFGVLFFDIDYFKKVNDTYGHNIGDVVLKGFSSLIKSNLRNDDIVARWGGEEFVVVIKVKNEQLLKNIAEKLRLATEKYLFDKENNKLNITVSIGGTMFQEDDTIDTIVERADKLMYSSKNNGRNQTTIE